MDFGQNYRIVDLDKSLPYRIGRAISGSWDPGGSCPKSLINQYPLFFPSQIDWNNFKYSESGKTDQLITRTNQLIFQFLLAKYRRDNYRSPWVLPGAGEEWNRRPVPPHRSWSRELSRMSTRWTRWPIKWVTAWWSLFSELRANFHILIIFQIVMIEPLHRFQYMGSVMARGI